MIKIVLYLRPEEVQGVVAMIGWGQHQALLSKLYAEEKKEREVAASWVNLGQAVAAQIEAQYSEQKGEK